jgi:hypothetical protein
VERGEGKRMNGRGWRRRRKGGGRLEGLEKVKSAVANVASRVCARLGP